MKGHEYLSGSSSKDKAIEVYMIIRGCGFPYFGSTVILIRSQGENILVDTSIVTVRDELIKNLSLLNLTPADIDHVILTHMHMDHYGNLDLFLEAKIYTTYPEYEFYKIITYNKKKFGRDFIIQLWKSLENWKPFVDSPLLLNNESGLYESIKELTDKQKKNLVFVKDGQILFDCLKIFRTYGHSVDPIGLQLVDHNRNNTLIVGDALPNRRRLERLRNQSGTTNVGQMYDRLNLIMFDELGNIVIPGHDRPFNTQTCEYVSIFDMPPKSIDEKNYGT